MAAGQFGNPADDIRRQDALGVIGKDDPVGAGDLRLQEAPAAWRLENPPIDARIVLVVQPAKLLVSDDDPGLGDRPGPGQQELLVEFYSPFPQVCPELVAVVVAADRPDNLCGGSEGRNVVCDIGRPPTVSVALNTLTTGTGASGEMRVASPQK